jgi:uncharacterized protein (TIGR02270 family)
MTAAPKLTYIPDIVEEHYDELQFLWTQRRNALRSPAYTERELLMLEERIEAHTQGMLVLGERILHMLERGLAGDDEMPAFAAAFALLRLATPDALRRVVEVFATSEGTKVHGLRDALAHGPSTPLQSQLTSIFSSAPPAVAAAAGEVLAFQGVSPVAQHLDRLIRAEDPAARAGAWRIVTYCGLSVPTEWYQAALRDDDPGVASAALIAAAWTRSPAFVAHCRTLAAQPTPEAIEPLTMFAAVAPPDEYQLVGAVAAHAAAGPTRFRVVGAFAHPYFIEFLIGQMANADPAHAAAAGAAFQKMTGRSVESNRRTKVSADGKPPADEFDEEFQDEVFLPDAALAHKYWQELAPRLAQSPRICRGMDVAKALSREEFASLDTDSRWEYCLRARITGGWQGTPLVLERYPQQL